MPLFVVAVKEVAVKAVNTSIAAAAPTGGKLRMGGGTGWDRTGGQLVPGGELKGGRGSLKVLWERSST